LLGFAWWPAWLALGLLICLHLTVGLVIALRLLWERGGWSAVLLPSVFLVAHLSYGWGYLRGLLSLVLRGRPVLPAKVTR
jgi:hypothetical protein